MRGREVHATIGKLSCVASPHDALLAWPRPVSKDGEGLLIACSFWLVDVPI